MTAQDHTNEDIDNISSFIGDIILSRLQVRKRELGNHIRKQSINLTFSPGKDLVGDHYMNNRLFCDISHYNCVQWTFYISRSATKMSSITTVGTTNKGLTAAIRGLLKQTTEEILSNLRGEKRLKRSHCFRQVLWCQSMMRATDTELMTVSWKMTHKVLCHQISILLWSLENV